MADAATSQTIIVIVAISGDLDGDDRCRWFNEAIDTLVRSRDERGATCFESLG